jgi:integrase/recombinase XerC
MPRRSATWAKVGEGHAVTGGGTGIVAFSCIFHGGCAVRFPAAAKRRSSPGGGLTAWPSAAPLFVGADGERITRGTLQYRVLRAFRRAGIDSDRARGALVHGLRHTFATELANADVSVYTLMKLLGHESMVTSQRYVTAAGTETRTAAAQNKLYGLLEQER